MGRVIARWDGSWWPSSLKLLLPLKDADFLVFHEPVARPVAGRIVVPARAARNEV
jgi:hypothetical protein